MDLDKRLVFRREVETKLKTMYGNVVYHKKLLIMMELTVQWESRIDEVKETEIQ